MRAKALKLLAHALDRRAVQRYRLPPDIATSFADPEP
jgi:hypothetical protein